jgi:hypothetical protein
MLVTGHLQRSLAGRLRPVRGVQDRAVLHCTAPLAHVLSKAPADAQEARLSNIIQHACSRYLPSLPLHGAALWWAAVGAPGEPRRV